MIKILRGSLPGKEKPTAVTFGRQVAANLINSTRGVDAWADLAITAGEGGRARIAATAYFPDLNLLKFDMPLVFVWKRDPASGGAGGAGGLEKKSFGKLPSRLPLVPTLRIRSAPQRFRGCLTQGH